MLRSAQLTLREALLTHGGPKRDRHWFMPELPDLPPSPAQVNEWSIPDLRRAIKERKRRLAVLLTSKAATRASSW